MVTVIGEKNSGRYVFVDFVVCIIEVIEGPFSSKGKKFWMSRRVFDQMSGGFFGH